MKKKAERKIGKKLTNPTSILVIFLHLICIKTLFESKNNRKTNQVIYERKKLDTNRAENFLHANQFKINKFRFAATMSIKNHLHMFYNISFTMTLYSCHE